MVWFYLIKLKTISLKRFLRIEISDAKFRIFYVFAIDGARKYRNLQNRIEIL